MRAILHGSTHLSLHCQRFDDVRALRRLGSAPLAVDLWDAAGAPQGRLLLQLGSTEGEGDGLYPPRAPGEAYRLLLPQAALDAFLTSYHWHGILQNQTSCAIYYPFYE